MSGGVDSSYVASYFGGQKAFTVGFDNGEHYNETQFAAELAKTLGIEHYAHLITEDEYWAALPEVQYHLDQPLADPACVALYFVSKLAAEHVKVVLSGEGADELFGGYRIYHEPTSLAGYQKLPRFLRRAAAAVVSAIPFDFKGKSFLIRGSKTLEERFIGNAYMFIKKKSRACSKMSRQPIRPARWRRIMTAAEGRMMFPACRRWILTAGWWGTSFSRRTV